MDSRTRDPFDLLFQNYALVQEPERNTALWGRITGFNDTHLYFQVAVRIKTSAQDAMAGDTFTAFLRGNGEMYSAASSVMHDFFLDRRHVGDISLYIPGKDVLARCLGDLSEMIQDIARMPPPDMGHV